jgi:hypothetical protein
VCWISQGRASTNLNPSIPTERLHSPPILSPPIRTATGNGRSLNPVFPLEFYPKQKHFLCSLLFLSLNPIRCQSSTTCSVLQRTSSFLHFPNFAPGLRFDAFVQALPFHQQSPLFFLGLGGRKSSIVRLPSSSRPLVVGPGLPLWLQERVLKTLVRGDDHY